MSKLGPRLVDSIREALDGNFASVTMDGTRWVRLSKDHIVVPINPTTLMISSGRDAVTGFLRAEAVESIYAAMIEAVTE